MRSLFLDILNFLERAFRSLEDQVPPPVWTLVHGQRHARYNERTPRQALVQKLARQISALCALDLLLLEGLPQEQGLIKRVLDEIHEDVVFIAYATISDDWTPRHYEYLEDFWAEEFDDPDPLKATQKRKRVSRQKIRAANARPLADNPHLAAEIERTLHNAYSGYVHATSSAVMEMCAGDPPRFEFRLPRSHPATRTLVNDAWNYFYRSLLSVGLIAKAFEDEALGDETYRMMFYVEEQSGRRYSEGFQSP